MINKVHLGDCLELMKDIPDGSIDMILCDLPYGSTNLKWDIVIPFDKLWNQYKRIIKENGAIVLTSQQPFATDLINSNRKLFRYEIIWEKTMKLGFLNANKMPLKGHENILIFYKKLPTYNPQKTQKTGRARKRNQKENRYAGYSNFRSSSTVDDGSRHPYSVVKFSNFNGGGFVKNKKKGIHPTQKPVDLFEWLIKSYTNEGDLVLDNCSGSGTTAIACIRNNRNYICIEKEEKYYLASLNRIENEKNINYLTNQ